MSLDTVTRPGTIEQIGTSPEPRLAEPGDNETFAHYAHREALNASAFTGEPVTALCGKTWTPRKDPAKFPVCPACKDVIGLLPPGGDDEEAERRGR